jgi:hypothetical protein
MIPSRKKMAIVAIVAAATVLGTTTLAFGSVAPGTVVTGHSGKTTFKGDINGVPITVTCTNFTDAVTVAKGDKTSVDIPPPTINGCTDTLKGTDTITTNDTNGSWKLTVNSSGTKLTLVMPKDGATFKSSVLSSCTIEAAPTKAVDITGTYSSSAGTDKVSKAPIAVKGSGCTATSSSTTTTVTFSPKPGKIPPFAS